METTKNENRNYWGALEEIPEWVQSILQQLDNGVAWTTGIESDKKLRGESINTSVYSTDAEKKLAVVQVRQCTFHPTRYNKIRKNYFLIGKNENGNAFAHAVNCTATNAKSVEKILCKIWECTTKQLKKIKRNGDIAFVPVSKLPANAREEKENNIIVRNSHVVYSEKLYRANDTLYAVGRSKIQHKKRQHKQAKIGKKGVWRIQLGVRGNCWNFSAPTAD